MQRQLTQIHSAVEFQLALSISPKRSTIFRIIFLIQPCLVFLVFRQLKPFNLSKCSQLFKDIYPPPPREFFGELSLLCNKRENFYLAIALFFLLSPLSRPDICFQSDCYIFNFKQYLLFSFYSGRMEFTFYPL